MKKFNRLSLSLVFSFTLLLIVMGVAFRPAIVRANGGTVYVNAATGSDTNTCYTSAAACKTIGGAIGKASSGDTINIAAGTYTETNIIAGKSLSLVGAGIDQTIVDGGGSSNVFNIYSNATVSMSGMTIQNGLASQGAGIRSAGPLTLTQMKLTNNLGDYGSAIYVYSTTLTIIDSAITGNRTNKSFGGIFADTNNYILLENTTVSGNEGQGLHIQVGGAMTLTNVTVSGNTGEGVASGSPVYVYNSTIVNNGFYQILNYGAITLTNSIVGSTPGATNCYGTGSYTSLGYNLDSGTACALASTGDITSTNPLLLPLGDYGGSTQTHGLPLNSPAIDAGNNVTCPATDQRGTARPQDGNGDATATCDIGAFELVRQSPVSVTISGNTSGLVNSSQSFVATVAPVTATQPITYVWEATNQTPVTHAGKGITDSISFNWAGTGAQVVTVTVNNGLGAQTDTHAFTVTAGTQAITGVTISGATSGSLGGTFTFNADVLPSNATQPITYSWQADGQSPVVHTGMGLTDSVTFQWTTEGTKTITVTATNEVGSQTDTHTIWLYMWYVNGTSGDDANDCLSPATACKTIGGAVGKAADSDTITVAAGTYTENLSVNKSLSFIGAGVDQTIVDGGASDSVFDIPLNTTVALSKMTIRNGSGRGGTGSGGGAYVSGALTLSQVRVYSNTANHGGALYIYTTGSVTATNSTFDQNKTTGNSVGAIFVDGGKLWLENSTVSGNSTESIHSQNSGTVDIFNSTISGNTGGISNGATMTMRNSTLANNSGGNAIFNGGTFTVKSSILAAPAGVDVCDTTSSGVVDLTSQGYNLESTNSCGLTATGDKTGVDPYLQSLADNGGDTWTHALLRPSPALDGGDNASCPATDQRGTARPIDGDGNGTATCDIGAFESPFVSWKVYLPLVIK